LLEYATRRIGNRLNRIEAAIDDELNVTLRKSSNTLVAQVRSLIVRALSRKSHKILPRVPIME
jgi:hypothetical protein